ncbi:MAG TPA: hypothetical protein PLP17_12380, partial [Oligoflexia bacterium]|nr:hypothetical protein [Oligoflexia bacterium]
MEILRSVSLYAEAKQMAFMVIGGHAVNAYGIARQTGDLDLVVPLAERELWFGLMAKLRYVRGQDDERFARFRPDSLASWPIDLMFVDDLTFAKLLKDSIVIEFGAAQARVVSPRHLATMKIHALKHYQAHRYAKDYSDLISLLRQGKTGISRDELSELC